MQVSTKFTIAIHILAATQFEESLRQVTVGEVTRELTGKIQTAQKTGGD